MDDPAELDRVGGTPSAVITRCIEPHPAPGAGPSLAWTCALAAALVEMVSADRARARIPAEPAAVAARRDRAAALRGRALELADSDVAAYTDVIAVLARRGSPAMAAGCATALSRAADPPLAIAGIAAELAALAAERGRRRPRRRAGEAVTAAVLAEAVARGCAPIVELNLGGARDDPRRDPARELAAARGRRARAGSRRDGRHG